jgi:hypothetical protein
VGLVRDVTKTPLAIRGGQILPYPFAQGLSFHFRTGQKMLQKPVLEGVRLGDPLLESVDGSGAAVVR